ncbi:bifunctional 5,10-methylenetetrahydrofolate dehydrogenase/5,10-methenyltetrahydrofolate cyclohydrolase [Halorutilales archaeon Cl-col2-1]
MEVIDGESVAEEVRDSVSEEVEEMETPPKLVAVLMSDDPASETYVSMKEKDCGEVGIESEVVRIDPSEPEEKLMSVIDDLNHDDSVDGFIVQLPLPDHVDETKALEAVSPEKDVDGFHPENKGLLMEGRPRFVPATPMGVQKLLTATGNSPDGKDVVILGRSDIVGKPLANLLVQKSDGANATVTVCHSGTQNVEEHTRRADIIVAAVGVPEFVTPEMVSEETVVIDVGINEVDGELVGDVDYEGVSEKAAAMTPVPGGVGPMTRAMLLRNTVEAAKLSE